METEKCTYCYKVFYNPFHGGDPKTGSGFISQHRSLKSAYKSMQKAHIGDCMHAECARIYDVRSGRFLLYPEDLIERERP